MTVSALNVVDAIVVAETLELPAVVPIGFLLCPILLRKDRNLLEMHGSLSVGVISNQTEFS